MVFFPLTHQIPIPNKDIISWIFDDPKYYQDEPMYIDAQTPSHSISLSQARILVKKLIAGFHSAGLQKGDCVCIHSFNDIHYPILVLGIIAAGGVFTGTNPSYTPFELTHHIQTADVRFVVTQPEMVGSVLEVAGTCKIGKERIWVFDVLGEEVPDGLRSWRSLLGVGERGWEGFDDEVMAGDVVAARLFSSGTTGFPKAVDISHRNLVAQHVLTQEINKKPWKQIRLFCLPMFHVAAVPIIHTSVLKAGAPAVIMLRFDLAQYLEATDRFAITEWYMVPPMVIAIVMSPLAKNYSLRSVRNVSIGAAPLSRESQRALKGLLDERAIVTHTLKTTIQRASVASYQIPKQNHKLIDDNGNEITTYDTPGERKPPSLFTTTPNQAPVYIRGPTVIKSYYKNAHATSQTLTPTSSLATGDIVYCSSTSQEWYHIDRKKELIKVRGFQVAPPEIESVLLSHPGILDAAVIGVKIRGEECPRAYVVRRPGRQWEALGEKEVRRWCEVRLARLGRF
ncbi:hypothetical protein HYALB_00001354 [Hymenoscyphus albidus]|uniref:Acetyl-CoA synthetase-like protein n=1 Tax=Hymenoscyphus albidus TaxID=595503 RepID=A0A9N9LCY0_9HELO|nr:hypothetical protein HYALB_00001354 [Hymenoscyphus albidus]